MNTRIRSIAIPFIFVFLIACGGGGASSNTQSSPAGVSFTKSTAEFKQYEVIELETNDVCNVASKVSIRNNENDIVKVIKFGSNGALLEMSQVIEPGQYTFDIDIVNTCTLDNNSSTISLDFVMHKGLTVVNPDIYLETRANEAIALFDQMLLTATDQPLIDMLLEYKALLLAEIDNISTQDSAITTYNANLLLNNDPLASLPVAGVLTTSRGLKIVASATLFGLATSSGAVPAAIIGFGLLVYNLLEFVKEYENSGDSLYSDISLKVADMFESIPTGVTITSGDITVETDLVFAEGQTTTIRLNKTSRIATDDKSTIDEVKSAITNLVSLMQNLEFLSSRITTAINTLSSANDVLVSDDKVETVTDLTGYTVSTFSTDDIFAEIKNTEAVLSGSDTLDILASSYSRVTIFDGFEEIGANFRLLLSDGSGNETSFSAVYQPLSTAGCVLSPLTAGDNGQDYGGICANKLHYLYDSESIYGQTDRYKVITCLEGCDNVPLSFNEAKESGFISSISRNSSWAIESGWTKYSVEKWDLFDGDYQMNIYGLAAGSAYRVIWTDSTRLFEKTINGDKVEEFDCSYYSDYKITYSIDAGGLEINGSRVQTLLDSCPVVFPFKPIPNPIIDN